jgi:type I restriction-modification system DNA methylase subunit
MFLHGVEASQTIKFGDSIENDQLPNDIDLIITNPPFGDIGIIPINRKFSIKTRNKQLNFIQHIIEKLKIGGKAAIVLTESIFKSEDAKKLWTYYLDKKEGGENVCNLHTILKLPTFFMSIKIRLYIVFLEKGKPSNQIWLYDIEKSASKAKKDSINEEVLEHFEKWYFERKQTDYSQILELSEFLGNSSKIGFKSFDECVIHKHKKLPQKVNKEYIQEKGKYPVISQSSVHEIIGYVDDETYLFNESLPVIIFGDHTRVFKYVDYPFAIHGYGVKIIIPNTDIVLPKYLFYVLKSSPISDLGYSRHFSEVSKLNIFVPPIHEQAKIVEKLDREISQLEKQEISIEKTKEEIKNRKQSLFEGVFNKYTNVVL